MTKAEIVEQIYERVGFSKKEAAELVEKVFDVIKETLAEAESFSIKPVPCFGIASSVSTISPLSVFGPSVGRCQFIMRLSALTFALALTT